MRYKNILKGENAYKKLRRGAFKKLLFGRLDEILKKINQD